jgi:hypothetical protein
MENGSFFMLVCFLWEPSENTGESCADQFIGRGKRLKASLERMITKTQE